MAVGTVSATAPETNVTNGEIHSNGIHLHGGRGNPDKSEKALMGPDQPIPDVSEFDFSAAASLETLLDDIVKSLRVSGGCVIRNMVGKDVLDQLEADIRPHLNAAQPAPGTAHFLAMKRPFLQHSTLT